MRESEAKNAVAAPCQQVIQVALAALQPPFLNPISISSAVEQCAAPQPTLPQTPLPPPTLNLFLPYLDCYRLRSPLLDLLSEHIQVAIRGWPVHTCGCGSGVDQTQGRLLAWVWVNVCGWRMASIQTQRTRVDHNPAHLIYICLLNHTQPRHGTHTPPLILQHWKVNTPSTHAP